MTLGRRYVVRTAENGAEAIKKVMAAKYDLIITDGDMPVLGGPEFVREIRALGITVPTILFSGNPLLEEFGVRLRTEGVLRKPHDVGELDALVYRILFSPDASGVGHQTVTNLDALQQTLLSPQKSGHLMLLCRGKGVLTESVGTYLKAGLMLGERAVAIASPNDLREFESYLQTAGIDVSDRMERRDLVGRGDEAYIACQPIALQIPFPSPYKWCGATPLSSHRNVF